MVGVGGGDEDKSCVDPDEELGQLGVCVEPGFTLTELSLFPALAWPLLSLICTLRTWRRTKTSHTLFLSNPAPPHPPWSRSLLVVTVTDLAVCSVRSATTALCMEALQRPLQGEAPALSRAANRSLRTSFPTGANGPPALRRARRDST